MAKRNKISLKDIMSSGKEKLEENVLNEDTNANESKKQNEDISFNNKPDLKGIINEAFETVTPYSDRASGNQRSITPEEISKLTNEGASSSAIKRMKSLVNINDIKALRKTIGSIADDMEDEGFESDETYDFILKYIQAVMRNY